MNEEQIEAEIARVTALVREYLAKVISDAEDDEQTDLRIHTWTIAAVTFATDEDGDVVETISAGFETRSRTMQAGILARLSHISSTYGNVSE